MAFKTLSHLLSSLGPTLKSIRSHGSWYDGKFYSMYTGSESYIQVSCRSREAASALLAHSYKVIQLILVCAIVEKTRKRKWKFKMAMAAAGVVALGHSSSLYEGRHRCFFKTKNNKLETGELGFVTSQLSGIKISYPSTAIHAVKPTSAPFTPLLQPVARRVCPFTGKKANKANRVSFSNHKTKKLQFVNLQYKRVWWEAGKRYLKLRLSTKALKTIEKNGLDAVAKKAGIDLRKK
ncbi:50S ribosomal protein L28, chloroplastic-like [Macadamia integrifolia]|uniref:50S ribosomal protein L28, chloroplastic-like n=1 Tax=Macadamia integrifolia TaxID=60698 RepID=UPI001C4E871C|nr:50S ribosomal protein L28, chloroplastic-like [Macadamia integrifolia]